MTTLIVFTDNPLPGNWLVTHDKVKRRLSQIKRKWNRVHREKTEPGVNRWEAGCCKVIRDYLINAGEHAGAHSRQPSCSALYPQTRQRLLSARWWLTIPVWSQGCEREKQERWMNPNSSGHRTVGRRDAVWPAVCSSRETWETGILRSLVSSSPL